VGVHVGVPAVRGGLAATAGLLRHEPHDRLLDQPVHPEGRIRCANPATWSSTNPAATSESAIVARAIRRARHAGSSPDRTPGPGLGEPVPQLQRLAEVGLAGLGGQPDRGRELGHTELRDQRCTRAGDRDRGVPEPDRVPIDSAGCRSAQVTASCSRSASAASAARRRSRANASTRHAVSAAVSRLVLVMAPF
jgi:hypothetical protein